MSTTKIFVPAGLLIDENYIGHVGQQSVEQNLEELTIEPAGDFAPNFTGHKSWAPEFSLESMDLTKVLDLCDSAGICGDLSAATVQLLERAVQRANLVFDADDEEHLVYQLEANSMIVWESISISQRDELKISFKIIPFDNGSNAILVPVPGEAIPAAATVNAPFTLGPLEITLVGGSPVILTGLKSLTWNLNPEIVKEDADGDASPGFVYVRYARPVIEFETTDAELFHDTFADDGNNLTKVTTWFRRRRPGKINYANNEAQHAKLESSGTSIGTLVWNSASGDPHTVKGRIAIHRSGTGDLFTYTKDAAIVTGATTTTTTTSGGT